MWPQDGISVKCFDSSSAMLLKRNVSQLNPRLRTCEVLAYLQAVLAVKFFVMTCSHLASSTYDQITAKFQVPTNPKTEPGCWQGPRCAWEIVKVIRAGEAALALENRTRVFGHFSRCDHGPKASGKSFGSSSLT